MELNLYEWIKGRRNYLPENKVKQYMFQLLKSLDHMHSNGIFHRDIKPENVLISDEALKLADFGSCRGIKSDQPFTEYISTRWYRPPECLLTDGYYNREMDIWGTGCVFFEVLALFPLFPGKNELDQVHKIHNIIGSPPQEVLENFRKKATHMEFNFPYREGTKIDKLIPHVSSQARDLIKKMLVYKSEDRISAKEALEHPYFKEMKGKSARISYSPSLRTPDADSAAGDDYKTSERSLPPIKHTYSKIKHDPKIKKTNSNKSITIEQKSPYSTKKIILEARKPYVSPYRRNFYKSHF